MNGIMLSVGLGWFKGEPTNNDTTHPPTHPKESQMALFPVTTTTKTMTTTTTTTMMTSLLCLQLLLLLLTSTIGVVSLFPTKVTALSSSFSFSSSSSSSISSRSPPRSRLKAPRALSSPSVSSSWSSLERRRQHRPGYSTSTSTSLNLGYLDLSSNTMINPAVLLHSSITAEDIALDTDFSSSNVVDNGVGDSSITTTTTTTTTSSSSSVLPTGKSQMISINDYFPAETEGALTATSTTTETTTLESGFLWSWLAPRLLLAGVACIYGSNCPIGSVMDHSMSYASAASSARFVIAAIAMAPFIPRLNPALTTSVLVAGTFTGAGYIAQSLALSEPFNVSPATVSFLGALTVVWCPVLEWIVDGEDTTWRARPQVWVAGIMCLIGVGILELMGGSGATTASASAVGIDTMNMNDLSSSSTSPTEWMGDGLAILQAIGFGTGLFLSERMMKRYPDQTLPVTATMIAVTALCSLMWVLSDGWIGNSPDYQSMFLPNILMDGIADQDAGEQRMLLLAVLWTGLISTSLNFGLEVYAMGMVPCGEASILLATEPLWACMFANMLLGESLGWNDAIGGLFIVSACLVTAFSTETLHKIFPLPIGEKQSPSVVPDP